MNNGRAFLSDRELLRAISARLERERERFIPCAREREMDMKTKAKSEGVFFRVICQSMLRMNRTKNGETAAVKYDFGTFRTARANVEKKRIFTFC